MKYKRGDLIQVGITRYLIAETGYGLQAWDFEAWAVGYYDAYLNAEQPPEDNGYAVLPMGEAIKIGNIYEGTATLPEVCEGYNGEPHAVKLETIWERPNE